MRKPIYKLTNMTPILKDTTLAMIVRDEMMNPAGGIERFLDAHLALVEEAVVVDTGSVDGTYEYLMKRAERQQNLRVFKKPWTGSFSDARNASLERVETKYVLILDADELLQEQEAQILEKEVSRRKKLARIHPTIVNIHAEGEVRYEENCLQPRWFRRDFFLFFGGDVGESFFRNPHSEFRLGDPTSEATIRHFLPSQEAVREKKIDWYGEIKFKSQQPKNHAGRTGWKELNPYRQFYS